jgi:hypothetical protein
MNIPDDFKEFIELLNARQVKYLIIGGYAVGFYSRPKFTNDIDVWIDNSLANALKVLQVLKDFGFEELDITTKDLSDPDKVIQLGVAPLRIDIITGLAIDFNSAYKNKTIGNYLGVKTHFISRDHLIKTKKLAGRKKDLDDIDWILKYSAEQE